MRSARSQTVRTPRIARHISTLPQNTSSVLRTGEDMNGSEVSEELGLDSKPEKTQWFIYRSCDSIRIKWNYLKFSIECIDTINLYVSWEQFLRVVLAKEKWRAPYFQQRGGAYQTALHSLPAVSLWIPICLLFIISASLLTFFTRIVLDSFSL